MKTKWQITRQRINDQPKKKFRHSPLSREQRIIHYVKNPKRDQPNNSYEESDYYVVILYNDSDNNAECRICLKRFVMINKANNGSVLHLVRQNV